MKSSRKAESAFDKEPEVEVAPSESKNSVSKKKFHRSPILMWAVIAAIVLGGAGSGIYYFIQYQSSQKLLKDPVLGARIETEKLIDTIGRFVELPDQEAPTVATVSDVTKLKAQSFFARAQNGDKVLIYSKAKKAILFRPSTNKIVEFGPINVDSAEQDSASVSASITPVQENIKLVLRNGTRIVGLASTVEKEIAGKVPNITVVAKDNASKQEFTKTLVVDLTGENGQGAAQVAKLVAGEVGNLPEGEEAPVNADILVVLGRP